MPIEQPIPTLNHGTSSQSTMSGRYVSFILLATLLWCVYWFVHARHYWEDDAFIHLDFARSVATGQGFAFNGKLVAGDTSPLWVLLLAGMHALVPHWMVAGKLLTILGAFIGGAGTYAFARRISRMLRPSPLVEVFPAAMVLLTFVNPYTCYWMFAGMEPLATAGVACFAVLASVPEEPSRRTFLIGCALAGIGPLLRPEMVFLTLLLIVPLYWQWRAIRRDAMSLLTGLVLICGPLAAWSLYSLHAFGHLFPNTNAAKRAGPGDSVLVHLLSLYSFGFPLLLLGAAGAIAYAIMRPSKAGQSLRNAFATVRNGWAIQGNTLPSAGWLLMVWASIASFFYVVDHTYVQTRYILISAPGLIVVTMAAALAGSQRLGKLLYGAILAVSIGSSLLIVRPFIWNKGLNCGSTKEMADFIRNQLPSNAPIALYAIGEVAFYSNHPLVDVGGITEPGVIPYLSNPAEVLRWARSKGAEYYIGAKPQADAELVFRRDTLYAGWTMHRSQYRWLVPLELWTLPPVQPTSQQAR